MLLPEHNTGRGGGGGCVEGQVADIFKRFKPGRTTEKSKLAIFHSIHFIHFLNLNCFKSLFWKF